MEPISTIISRIQFASPLELDGLLETINWQAFQENGWDLLSVKESYTDLLAGIEDALKCLNTGKESRGVNDFQAEVQRISEKRSAIAKLQVARDFFRNPPIVENPNPKGPSTPSIDWSKPVFTAEEVRTLLNVSDSTFRRWINAGWFSYTQLDGSDKKYIQKEHLLEFLNHKKNFFPSSK